MADRYDAMMARRMRQAQARQRRVPWRGVGSEQVTDAQIPRDEPNGPAADAVAEAAPGNGDFETVLAERDRYLDQLQRTAADYANYRRRTEQERAQQRLLANEQLLREFVPALDDLQRGLEAIPPAEQDSQLAAGMRLVEQKLLATLKKHGVTPIESLSLPFDPAVHEAVEAEPGGDTVVAVYAPGYRLGEGVLRPAMVKVGQGRESEVGSRRSEVGSRK